MVVAGTVAPAMHAPHPAVRALDANFHGSDELLWRSNKAFCGPPQLFWRR